MASTFDVEALLKKQQPCDLSTHQPCRENNGPVPLLANGINVAKVSLTHIELVFYKHTPQPFQSSHFSPISHVWVRPS